jgi:hypothetical protein|tara:strand:- start:1742 stop:1954 length:213 start_codon:yes stop_codon:yes gene_type:complete
MAGGRPRRTDLPEGIGIYPDYVVSVIAEERGEKISAQGVRYLREVNDIPPASEPYRTKWKERRAFADDDF